jgi:plastocyanin
VRLVGALAIGLVAALTACSGSDVDTGSVAGRAGGKPVPAARAIDVDASNFEFDPDEITIDAKEEVAITLHSTDGPHDLAVDGLGRVTDVGGGGSATARLRIDERGRYTFFCTLPGHRDGGMEGTVVVRR